MRKCIRTRYYMCKMECVSSYIRSNVGRKIIFIDTDLETAIRIYFLGGNGSSDRFQLRIYGHYDKKYVKIKECVKGG